MENTETKRAPIVALPGVRANVRMPPPMTSLELAAGGGAVMLGQLSAHDVILVGMAYHRRLVGEWLGQVSKTERLSEREAEYRLSDTLHPAVVDVLAKRMASRAGLDWPRIDGQQRASMRAEVQAVLGDFLGELSIV